MTIIVFLIDTSASMFQRTFVGGRTSLLDVAKSAVETFVKIRQRSPESRIDRYMLLTFEEPPNNIKAGLAKNQLSRSTPQRPKKEKRKKGWKENLATFMNELKNLQCYSMTTMGVAVKQAFDVLNINRVISGIDTYGQGRCPFFLETAVIVLITDGGKLSTVNGVHDDFTLPMNQLPGSEMTREPFRWDQRLFALVLRLTGTPAIDRDTGLVPSDSSPIDAMCEVTGGRSYCITSHRMLNQCIDSLVQKVQNGVVINFEKIGPDPPLTNEKGEEIPTREDGSVVGTGEGHEVDYGESNNTADRPSVPVNLPTNTSWYTCRKMIYVPRQTVQKAYPIGFWPIPESFWPEVTASVLPPRTAHPSVKFTCTNSDPMVIENLPFDKYELEPSPLTQYILARKQPTICWQVFVANSYKNSEVGHPFGYLKASTNLSCVNLFVMPYNYPVLLPLLEELFKVHRWKPTPEWRTQFQNYMRTLPAYYASPMRRALTRMGTPLSLAQTLIPENAETCLSYSVMNYLKKLKNAAKAEYDRMCNDIIQRQAGPAAFKNQFNTPEQIRVVPRVNLKKDLISHPLLTDKFNAQKEQIIEQGVIVVGTMDKERNTVSFRNPFDIPRHRLMQQVARMRNNFLQSDWVAQDQDSAHALPISQMGNYQEYLKRQTPQLRELESTPVRQHMFGNPFKIDKRMMVDEADIDLMGAPGASRSNKRANPTSTDAMSKLPLKRKPGPLPRDLVARRPSVDCTPPASPVHSPQPSPILWLKYTEKSNIFEEPAPTNNVAVNGNDTPVSERSRSPSPTLEGPFYTPPESNALPQRTYSTSSESPNDLMERAGFNSTPIIPSYAVSDDKQISQILKEANSMMNSNTNSSNSVNNNGIVPFEVKKETKVPVESKQEVDSQNLEIRKCLYRLVRRPGRNFTELFENIRTLKGNTEVQVAVVKLVIKESLRFKRQYLASLLEEHVRTMLNMENK